MLKTASFVSMYKDRQISFHKYLIFQTDNKKMHLVTSIQCLVWLLNIKSLMDNLIDFKLKCRKSLLHAKCRLYQKRYASLCLVVYHFCARQDLEKRLTNNVACVYTTLRNSVSHTHRWCLHLRRTQTSILSTAMLYGGCVNTDP